MSKLLHLTDPHLCMLNLHQLKKLCKKLSEYKHIVITGDISEATDVEAYLNALRYYVDDSSSIYFVAGNHDYYHGSIEEVRKNILSRYTSDTFCWLGNSKIIGLNSATALIGHDGWYDGLYKPFERSHLVMNDLNLITELRFDAFSNARHYSKQSADYVFKVGTKALEKYEHVYVATHVAPFQENSLAPNRRMSDGNWMPYFSSKYMGEVLTELALNNPDKTITVLCGHNHTDVHRKLLPNLECYTGPAAYGRILLGEAFEV